MPEAAHTTGIFRFVRFPRPWQYMKFPNILYTHLKEDDAEASLLYYGALKEDDAEASDRGSQPFPRPFTPRARPWLCAFWPSGRFLYERGYNACDEPQKSHRKLPRFSLFSVPKANNSLNYFTLFNRETLGLIRRVALYGAKVALF